MKLIEQSCEWIQKPKLPLEIIEKAGRTCYKSEDKITSDSAKRFVKSIIKRGHESVIEHVSASVRFITNRGVTHELVRHRLCAFCLSGDTKILRYNQNRNHLTIEELYNRQNDSQLNGRNKLLKLRSITPNNVIVANKLIKVMKSGNKEVYKVKTKLGYEIKTSLDHIFFTPNGQIKLNDLKTGDKVLVNGLKSLDIDKWWLYNIYHVENRSIEYISKKIGCSYYTVRKYLQKYNMTKKIGSKPIDFIPWNKGLTENDDHRVKNQANALRENHHNNGNGENNSNWKGDDIQSDSGKRSRFYKLEKKKCHYCDSIWNLENHHKDGDVDNYNESNKRTLCRECHELVHHGYNVKKVIPDEIVSIENVGMEMTYDIEMNYPYHNFIANGFVVHNSQESTRYVNYGGDDIQFIKPVWADPSDLAYKAFLKMNREAEDKYKRLLQLGWRPEQAREILPNSLKTEIVTTTNLREWRHIFKLRTGKAAHPQIRYLMKDALDMFKNEVPVVFDNI